MTIFETLKDRLQKYETAMEKMQEAVDALKNFDFTALAFMQGRIAELAEVIQLLFPSSRETVKEEIVRHYMDEEDIVDPPPAELMDPIIAEYNKLLSDDQRFSLAEAAMKLLTDEQRYTVMTPYCRHCGSPDLPCYCNDDE